MADYSFSSSAMRKRKSNFKTKPVLGDSSDPPPTSVTPQTPSAQTSSSPSPTSTATTKTGSGSEKDTKKSISPMPPSNLPDKTTTNNNDNNNNNNNNTSSSGSSKVQQYIHNLNNSKWSPPMVSDDSDHEYPMPAEKTKSRTGTGSPQQYNAQTGKTFTRKPALDDSSVDSLDDSSSSSSSSGSTSSGSAQSQSTTSSSSDDSEHETTKKIDKYRLKYLKGDIDGKNYGKPSQEKGSPKRDSDTEEVPTIYQKYKKQLHESKRSDEKWLSPKQKLGAPPEIDYNYRYLNAPKAEEKSQALQDTSTKQPKKKLDLKSQKINKDDLGILASMLGDDSSTGEVSAHGIFSVGSDDDSGIMRTQQRKESVKKLSPKKPGSLRGVSNNSVKSNNKDAIKEGGTEDLETQSLEGVHSIGGGKEKPESPKESVSIRIAKLQQERREKESTSFSSHSARSMTSDLDEQILTPAPETKNRRSSVGVPPMIREDEVEEELGMFLEKDYEERATTESKVEMSERSEDDFSAIWAQSVAASRANEKPQVDDESSSEGSMDFQGQQDNLMSAPRARAEPASNSVQEKKTERPSISRVTAQPSHSTVTLEASNSTAHYEASGRSSSASENSARWGASDELPVEQNGRASYATNKPIPPAPPPRAFAKSNEVPFQNLDSESDESVDFEKLTGLEQYTMGESKGSSLELETPVVTNKKQTTTKRDEKDTAQTKQYEKDSTKTKRDEKEVSKAKRDETDASKNKQDEKDSTKTKRDEKDATKTQQYEKDAAKTKRDDKNTNRNNGQKGQLMAISNFQEEKVDLETEDSDVSLDMGDVTNKRQQQQPMKAQEKKKIIPHDNDDDSSMSGFSLNASKDLLDQSSAEFNKPEYKPQRNNMSAVLDFNDGFQNLDSSSLLDIEDPPLPEDHPENKSDTHIPSTGKSDNDMVKPKLKPRQSLFSTGLLRHLTRTWAFLFASAAIGLPIYFLLFFGEDDETLPAPLDLFLLPPTLAPSIAPVAPPTFPPNPTTTPVAVLPTQMPSIPTVPEIPTPSPTRSRISLLREFLISVWPSLEDDLVGISSPQFAALNWLANNANYDDYSDERLVQRFALATLFYSTRGYGWRNNDLWLSDVDECTWYSRSSESQCDGSGSYIRLSLGLNDLSGTIPSEVALLENLLEIDFSTSSSAASLSSTIPSEIGLLVDLQVLILRGNSLTGTLASEIGNFGNLDNLDLSNNRLSGDLPSEIGGLTRLRLWNLSGNSLSGSLPTAIGLMTALQQVKLSNNDLTGPLPAELGRLSLLNSLDLTQNRLSRLPTELDTLVLLQKFSVANNQLEGPLPSGIGNSIELLSLELQNNRLTGTIPTEIGNLIELRDVLDLSNNELSGSIPTELGRLIFLRNILLQNNRLTGSVPTSFAALRRVSVLRLESNDLTGVVPDATCAVFNQTFPVFTTDCTPPEIVCPCCMFCCEDNGNCSCQFADSDLSFLCSEFIRAPGLENRIVT